MMKVIQPMEPIMVDEVKKGDNLVHQIKWDGIRLLSYIDGSKLRLLTKNGVDRTGQYPELNVLLEINGIKRAVFDGEAICIKRGMPSFRHILIRNRTGSKSTILNLVDKMPVYYMIFDLIHLNGVDLVDRPFRERNEILNELVVPSDRIRLVKSNEDADSLYELVKNNKLEGIVSKDVDSTYTPGKRHSSWFKYKFFRKMLCAVCGIKLDNANTPKSIITGIYNDEKFILTGSVASGLTQRHANVLSQFKEQLKIDYNPFTGENHRDEHIIWFNPIITCWVAFAEWSEGGIMRHPRLLGFSDERVEKADGTEFVE